MGATDIKFAAREALMVGMQIAIANCSDEVVQRHMIDEFRVVEKRFGYKPGSWNPFP